MSNLRPVSGEAHVDEQLSRVQVTSDRLRTETIVGRCHRTRGHGDCRRDGERERERERSMHTCTNCLVPYSYMSIKTMNVPTESTKEILNARKSTPSCVQSLGGKIKITNSQNKPANLSTANYPL